MRSALMSSAARLLLRGWTGAGVPGDGERNPECALPDPVILPAPAWRRLVERALERSGASPEQARPTARALVMAERDGQAGHGLSRVPSYAAQLRSGKVAGRAEPKLERLSPAASRVDGAHGFAYPALDLAVEAVAASARRQAVAVAAVRRSHHFGQAGATVERLAAEGFVALLFGNSPRAMAFHGGGGPPRLGTNPIAFAAPVPGRPALVIDLATSAVARGRIVAAQKAGRAIPQGWAVDAAGEPTTDPAAALEGSLLPLGGVKGSALALMVEVLAAALTGSAFGWEASSLFEGEGRAPDLGQTLLALDPGALNGGASAGGFGARMTDLAGALAQDGARAPGDRRLEARALADARGLAAPEALHEEIVALAEA